MCSHTKNESKKLPLNYPGPVTLVEVATGSLAERTGLEKGDIIAQIAGSPLSSVADMVEAVNRQPAGTWLPILVKRGSQSLEMVVKFPPEAATQSPAGQ